MAVEMDRHPHGLFEASNEMIGIQRREEPGHVLDTEGIGAQVFQLFLAMDTKRSMLWTGSRYNKSWPRHVCRRPSPRGWRDPGCARRSAHQNAKHIDAVGRRPFDEFVEHVVGVMPVSYEVLSAATSATWCSAWHPEGPEALPGIFLEKAKAGVERRPTPRPPTTSSRWRRVLGDRQHVFRAHSGGKE